MTVRDVNEFVDGLAHEASMKGSIRFTRFQGKDNVTYALDERSSLFNYLIVNRASGEAEMRYHLEFSSDDGTAYVLEGRKYMQKTGAGTGAAAVRDLLGDYTTLYCHVYKRVPADSLQELGLAYLKFRTFEDHRRRGQPGRLSGIVSNQGDNRPHAAIAGPHAVPGLHGTIRSARVRPAVAAHGPSVKRRRIEDRHDLVDHLLP